MLKKVFFILFAIIFISVPAYGFHETDIAESPKGPVVQQCPKTLMTESCLQCHTAPTFAIKEGDPTDLLDLPYNTKIFKNDSGTYGYYLLTAICADSLLNMFTYFNPKKEINHIIIEIHCPGGSMVEAWRMVGLMNLWKDRFVLETRIHGFGASAAFMCFCSGTKDYRFASPRALLMWHELWSFKFFSIETPTSTEESARVMRFLQDNSNEWLAEVSSLSKKELDKLIASKDFWMNGIQAKKYGFADGFK